MVFLKYLIFAFFRPKLFFIDDISLISISRCICAFHLTCHTYNYGDPLIIMTPLGLTNYHCVLKVNTRDFEGQNARNRTENGLASHVESNQIENGVQIGQSAF